MPSTFVLTLTGPDRIGIVERVTGLLLARGGNVATSRMARLGGEFAVLMLVAMPEEGFAGLERELGALAAEGFKVTTSPARATATGAHAGWLPFRIEVEGADHEGIIHEVAHYLSGLGITIESADSETTSAPVSGSPLFAMTAEVLVPPGLAGSGWESGLDAIAGRLNLEVRVTPEQRA
ncbi:MAG TPA: ACT domain-containing protein [Isosphaeraceae bacterium]|jgi:glycine cleavage system transcriptional repressor|nr:ACT domain-containing protein [Isosphaeraceae bacterium]